MILTRLLANLDPPINKDVSKFVEGTSNVWAVTG